MRDSLPSTGLIGGQHPPLQAAFTGDEYDSSRRRHTPDEDGGEFSQALAALWRRKWLIALVTGVGMVLSTAVLLSVTPRYTAIATLVLDTRPTRVLDVTAATVSQLLGGPQADVGVVQTELAMLRSPLVADIIIRKLDLLQKAEFAPESERLRGWMDETVRETLDAVRPWLDLPVSNPAVPPAVEGETAARERAIEIFSRNLSVTTEPRSYVIRVAYQSTDPELAANIANAVAETYTTLQLAARREAVNRANNWLAERAAELRQQVHETERAAEQFKEESGLSEVRGMTVNAQQLSELNSQIIVAASERAQKTAELREVQAARAPNGNPAALASPLLQYLREQEAVLLNRHTQLTTTLGPSHPQVAAVEAQRGDLRRSIEREIDARVKALTADVRAVAAREEVLRQRMAGLQAEHSAMTEKRVQLRQLEREAEANRTTFANLLSRWKQIEGDGNLQQPDARVIASARVPSAPSFPNLKIFLPLSGGGFILAGLIVALALELSDRTVRTVRDLERVTSRRCIGFTPAFSRSAAADELVLRRDTSLYADAIRSIRLSVARGNHDAPPKVILVSSSVPGEGKSVFALSLARSAAQAAYRTLLIDCDLRRPSINRLLRQAPGVDFVSLCSSAERSPVITPAGELVQNDSESPLHFIASSGHSRSPQDLLSSPGTRDFLERMREAYDIIVLDTPPLLAATDALVLASLADTTVFLVRWGSTPRAVVGHALQMLMREGVAVAGTVLSRVDMRKYRLWGEKEHGHFFAHHKRYVGKRTA